MLELLGYGKKSVDLAAPGSDIYSTIPNGKYASLSGTSMATPHVAGVAAMVWMMRPEFSMVQVKETDGNISTCKNDGKIWEKDGKKGGRTNNN